MIVAHRRELRLTYRRFVTGRRSPGGGVDRHATGNGRPATTSKSSTKPGSSKGERRSKWVHYKIASEAFEALRAVESRFVTRYPFVSQQPKRATGNGVVTAGASPAASRQRHQVQQAFRRSRPIRLRAS